MKVSCIVFYNLYFINYSFSDEFETLKVVSSLLNQHVIEKIVCQKRVLKCYFRTTFTDLHSTVFLSGVSKRTLSK